MFNQLLFGGDAKQRLLFAHPGSVFDSTQGVKHHHMGYIPTLLCPAADLTRKPVMAVYEIVLKPFLNNKVLQSTGKITKIRINGQFMHMPVLAGLQMNNANVLIQVDDEGVVRVVNPGIYIYVMPPVTQFTGEFTNINIHSAGVLGPQLSHRAGMYAEHGYS